MDGGAWWAAVHGVTESWTRLSDFTFTFHFHALEKEMATHSSVLAWRISGTVEPGGLLSMGSHSVGHDWNNLAAAAGKGGAVSSPVSLFIKNEIRSHWLEVSHKSCLNQFLTKEMEIYYWLTPLSWIWGWDKLPKRMAMWMQRNIWEGNWEVSKEFHPRSASWMYILDNSTEPALVGPWKWNRSVVSDSLWPQRL